MLTVVLSGGVSSQQHFEASHPIKGASPERTPQGVSRMGPSLYPLPSAPLRIPRIAPFLCNSKLIHSKGLSAPISPLESALTRPLRFFRISLKTNGRQVLYNQHLRVFLPQVLYIQQIHKNMGGRGVGYLPSYPSDGPFRLADRSSCGAASEQRRFWHKKRCGEKAASSRRTPCGDTAGLWLCYRERW